MEKKVKKKVVKRVSEAEKRPATKRLDQAEMRKLEELSSSFSYMRSQSNLQDQYCANVILKQEKLKADIALLEYELKNARANQKDHENKIKEFSDKLQKYGNELKLKYDLKNTQEGIKYNPLTGELIDK